MTRLLQALLALTLLLSPVLHASADDFLDPEQAFKLSVKTFDAQTAESCFEIAPGYYMYRDQFHAEAFGATLGAPVIPPGKTKFDETFQKTVEIYRQRLCVQLPVTEASGLFKLTVTGQGCADKGLCYPPMTAVFELRLAAFGGRADVKRVEASDATTTSAPAPAVADTSETGRLDAVLQSGHFWTVLGVFFVAGLDRKSVV